MRTIGIDCRLAGEKHAGIGRYIEELVVRVTKDTSVNWVLFFFEKNQIELPSHAHIKIVITPIRHYSLAEQLILPFLFWREHLDLLHVPHYNVPILYPGKCLITIHDLLWHTQSNSDATTLSPIMHSLKYQAYMLVTALAVKKAQTIIVPAQAVKKEVLRIFPTLHSNKVVVTYEGANEKFSVPSSQLSVRQSKILFYTGSLYPHKNVMLIVNALRKLPEYELFISSSRSVFVDSFLKDVSKLSVGSRVHHLGRLTDSELIAWYKKSFALVQPSLSEGFGLTGIEAMAAGLPVLASDLPIFQEIYKDACIPFDPHNFESFVQAVGKLEHSNRDEIIEKGKKVARTYSWNTMAQQTLEIYAQA